MGAPTVQGAVALRSVVLRSAVLRTPTQPRGGGGSGARRIELSTSPSCTMRSVLTCTSRLARTGIGTMMAVAAQAMAIGQLVVCEVWCGVSGVDSLIGA